MELRIKQSSTVEKMWGNGIKMKKKHIMTTEETSNNQPINTRHKNKT